MPIPTAVKYGRQTCFSLGEATCLSGANSQPPTGSNLVCKHASAIIPATGLLTATDVTVNGTKQRVSAVTYDDLGRILSVTRGAEQNSGGKVSYKYNIHGQTTEITGPGLTQNLYYADWSGTKLYNGSVSAMTWKMEDSQIRGYKYSYNDYSWLTEASYGEGESLGSNKNRYSEKFTSFTRNGGVRELFRNGLKANGTYGNVDFLSVVYNGNQVYRVVDGAPVVTQNGSMDFPGGIKSNTFTYNDFGALTADSSRGISDITYDNFGNPTRIQFDSGQYTTNVYSANGEKLKTTIYSLLQQMPLVSDASELEMMSAMSSDEMAASTNYGFSTTEYRGSVIYRNGTVDMVMFPGGYATINGTSATFHYYMQDYLGNNRAVINGSTGAIEQTVAYYPYGGVIADLGTNRSKQQYKFGGKELMTANGLNEYDFGARQYYSAVPGFTKPDPLCESFSHLSPYLYCANNPVNLVDRNGLAPTEEEAARMADYVYGQEKIKLTGGWKESQRSIDNLKLTDDHSGFKSGLFERTVDGVTEYAYAYAGTDFTSEEDWKNNFQQVFGQSEQYAAAIKNAGVLKETISEELTFVGHSLGGGLAAASAYATGGHAITFNAAGVSSATIDTSSAATVDAFVTRNDELHKFQSITPGVPIANGNIHWRSGNSSLLGHSVKNFYQPSIASRIYNQFKDLCIRGMNQINTLSKPSNVLGF